MAPNASTNWKNVETWQRLVAAMVASMGPNARLDYRSIARFLGGGNTESAVEHRFRPVRVAAEAARAAVDRGLDPCNYEIFNVKREKIQSLFGASTPDGIAFQFRTVKANAKILQDAVDNGNDPVEAFARAANGNGGSGAGGSVPATPSARTPGTGNKRARAQKTGGTAASSSKRRKVRKPEPETDDDEDSPDVDYDALDTTPTKRPKARSTPRQNPQELLPRSAWAKPAPGEQPARRSSFATAAAAALSGPAATPSYTFTHVAGIVDPISVARRSYNAGAGYAVGSGNANVAPANVASGFNAQTSYFDPAFHHHQAGVNMGTGMGMPQGQYSQAQFYDSPAGHQTGMSTTPMGPFSPSVGTTSEVNTPSSDNFSASMAGTFTATGYETGYANGYSSGNHAAVSNNNINNNNNNDNGGFTSFKSSEPGSDPGSASTNTGYGQFPNDDESLYTTSSIFNNSGYHHQDGEHDLDEQWDNGEV